MLPNERGLEHRYDFSYLKTESVFSNTDGEITRTAILGSTATHTILIFTATINEAEMIKPMKATTCLMS